MIRSTDLPPTVTMGDQPVTDPVLLEKFRDSFNRFKANAAWFESHAAEIGQQHAGRFICVAGQELFVGDDVKEVIERARRAHPEDWGGFFTTHVSSRRES
jgi:hypothetical protein